MIILYYTVLNAVFEKICYIKIQIRITFGTAKSLDKILKSKNSTYDTELLPLTCIYKHSKTKSDSKLCKKKKVEFYKFISL